MSNVPKVRFKEFSGEWDKIKIQKLIDNKSIKSHLDGNHGALYPRSEEFTKTGVPYVAANDFINGKVDLEKCKCLPLERASQFKKGIAKNGDVLFAHNATVGPVALLETDLDYVILSTTATYYRCDNDRLLNNYLKVYFNTYDFIKQYSRVMSQSTRNQVPITTQRLFHISLPSKIEQEKIASFLASVDTKIEQLTKKEELLSSYKKGVMQKIFSGEIRFKADDGSEFAPWEEKKITNIAKTSIGLVTSMTPYYVDNGIPLIRNNDIFPNKIRKNKLIQLDYDFDELNKNRRLLTDDIVTVHTGDIGISAVIDEELDGSQGFATLNTRIIDNKKVNPSYLCWYYNSIQNIRYALSMATGDGRSNYNLKDFNRAIIPLPCIKEQTKIANFLSSIDSKCEQVQKQLDSTKDFKKALLQQMFV